MPRTTLNIEEQILTEVKELRQQTNQPLGKLVTHLLALDLANRRQETPGPAFQWHAKSMTFLVNIEDKDALHEVLDRDDASILTKRLYYVDIRRSTVNT